MPWCIVCQSPHSLNFCAVAQFFSTPQQTQPEEGEKEKSHDDVACYMINSCDGCE